MQVKFLKNVVENLINKDAVPIVDLLVGKKDVNEFNIANKLGLTINQTRNILYKLSDYGLVSFIRKKDKRKGWYIYYWTLNIFQSLSLLEKNLKDEMDKLELQLKSRKERRFYICNTCSIEVSEEFALLNDFTCPECEEIYELSDSKEIIEIIEKNIVRVKKEIDLVRKERDKEGDKLEKKRTRKIKKAEKDKKIARRKKAAKRKEEKEKEEGSSKSKTKNISKKKAKGKIKKNLKKSVKKKSVKKKSVKKKSVKKRNIKRT